MPGDADARALYVISVAAELAGVHPQTLRIYERKGLIEPAAHERPQPALLRARHRAAAPDPGADQRGISLVGVQRVLALEDQLGDRARTHRGARGARIDALREEIEARVEAVHREYRRELVPLRSATVMRFETRR